MAWGTETRAADGCIATFELESGEIRVEHFSQLTVSRGPYYVRVRTKVGMSYIEQVVERADELSARVVSISTPTTILRDLGGTRAQQKESGREKVDSAEVQLPERTMLGLIGRLDLLAPTTHRRDTESTSIPRVTRRKPTHTGLGTE